jgi:GT2 family glycosyltransferase
VVELDPSRPFSAARARNEGFACLQNCDPKVPYVQFLDGDCDLVDGWLEQGVSVLLQRPDAAIVCGYVRELYPDATIYNTVCDLEWRQTPGEIRSSGGRFLIRREVFEAVGGFRPDVIAAEDDELCIRVRGLGWKILQLDAEMARHDIAMTSFGQWWRRAKRTGHAFAQVAALHGGGEERYFVEDVRRVLLWGLALPVAAICLAPLTYGVSLLSLLCAYALQFARTYLRGRKCAWSPWQAFLFSIFTALYKFPAVLGIFEYHMRQRRGNAFKIIEYKRSP